jgi:poly(3-hydroxybutyrate) depolymerase
MGDEAIVVHADALGAPTSWNNQADVPFFDALLAELTSSLCIDTERVFATGGFFTNTLGCQSGDVPRAIAQAESQRMCRNVRADLARALRGVFGVP